MTEPTERQIEARVGLAEQLRGRINNVRSHKITWGQLPAGIRNLFVDIDSALTQKAHSISKAQWSDGEPSNLEAAAEDAYEWLSYLQSHSSELPMRTEEWDKLDRCMEALRGFMRPNDEANRRICRQEENHE